MTMPYRQLHEVLRTEFDGSRSLFECLMPQCHYQALLDHCSGEYTLLERGVGGSQHYGAPARLAVVLRYLREEAGQEIDIEGCGDDCAQACTAGCVEASAEGCADGCTERCADGCSDGCSDGCAEECEIWDDPETGPSRAA